MKASELRELTRNVRAEKESNTLSPVIGGVIILVCNDESNHKNKEGFWKINPRNYNKVARVDLPNFTEEDITWRRVSENNFFGKAVYSFCTQNAKYGYETLPEDNI